MNRLVLLLVLLGSRGWCARAPAEPVAWDTSLAAEVRARGWIAFSAQTPAGDWDLFRMRPDGTERQPLTVTREFHEAGVRYSPEGTRLLYYRIPRGEELDNNTYGTFDLVIADANGRHARVYGREYSWASWGPDGRQIACLAVKGIQIVDLESGRIVRTVARQGLVQQLVWSPDGRAFAGTANGLGPFWNIGRLGDDGSKITTLSETERYNCTPDWFPDSRQVLYARGIVGGQSGFAQLWRASVDGHERSLVWAESGRHIYGGCASPDGQHVVFTRSAVDLGGVGRSSTTMALVRLADTPMLGESSPALREAFPAAKPSRWLDLGPGWEPHWTCGETTAAP